MAMVPKSCVVTTMALTIAVCLQSLQLSGGNDAYLAAMNGCVRELLALWFSVGFLTLERVTWQSPCDMLQKVRRG